MGKIMRLRNKIDSHLKYIVTAGIFRLLLCKRSYTLYIGIFLIQSVEAQNLDLGLYRITDTLYNDTISLFEKDINRIKKKSGFYDGVEGIEFLKDSLFKDSIIQKIRKFPIEYTSSHGGTFDYYNGTMINGSYQRIHTYGSSAYEGTYNEDKYFKNGKIIAWIISTYLPYEPDSSTRIHFYIFSAESVLLIEPENKSVNKMLIINNNSAQTKINDTITHDGYSGISIYEFIENYKDSVFKDSDIKLIRMINPICTSDHGGTFDVYDCKTYIEKELARHHTYGWRQGYQYNNDYYYRNGKVIKMISAVELKNEVEGKSYTRIHIYEF
jgi:hypothetical protein